MAKSKTPVKKPAAKKAAAKSSKAPSTKTQAPTVNDAQTVNDGGLKIETNRPEQNGVTRPSSGTFCAKVWEALDALHGDGKEITIEAIRASAGTEMADATIRTQRQRWRTFLGLPRNAKPSKSV